MPDQSKYASDTHESDPGMEYVWDQTGPGDAKRAVQLSVYTPPKRKPGWRDRILGIIDIIVRDKRYGIIGSVLMLPALSVVGLFCFFPYLLGTPFRIAFTILANLLVLGSAGYILGDRFKPYEYTSRAFLILAIVGSILGIVGGVIAGIAYVLCLVLQILIAIVQRLVTIAFIGGIVVLILAAVGRREGGGNGEFDRAISYYHSGFDELNTRVDRRYLTR